MEPISPPSSQEAKGTEQTEGVGISQSQEPTRSDNFWFEDGSVVLQAELKLFRVHRTLLARHSPIFQDMFLVGQNDDDSNEQVDGRPLVHLLDSASDVEHLLYYVYDRSESTNPFLSLPYISAKLLLGKKYNIRPMYDDALDILETNFPSNITISEHCPLIDYWDRLNFERAGLLDVINLALKANVLTLLPAAYLMTAGDLNAILDGIEREDGSRATIPFASQRACILGRDKILREAPTVVFSWCQQSTPLPQFCVSQALCRAARNAVVQEIWNRNCDDLETYLNPVDSWQVGNYKLCNVCLHHARNKHNEGRRKMWDALPTYFGLPPWDELLEQARLNAP
ncbi:hypothetical protein CPB83DRAFT_401511 [Crepidotus variabilis]|uniref:BTB domain-containing protein n=1 Tax=Crepidotus variabilis TaxID=179855 RepID=A0A9P6EDB2_9AGAR|nr:hypothetical protein CPB83DRAFT_401511 [Crepidotus variabilis]